MALGSLNQARHSQDANRLRAERETEACQAKLQAMVADANRTLRHERTKLFVIDVTDSEVVLLADASWGWPTGDLIHLDTTSLERKAPKASAVWLHPENAGYRDTISLRIGQDIAAPVAKTLRWGERVLVEFDVRRIALVAPDFIVSQSNAPSPSLEKAVVISVANMRCPEEQPRFYWFSSAVWPARGTFPDVIARTSERSQTLLPFFQRTVRRGSARLKVERVDEDEIVFDTYVSSPSATVPVYLAHQPPTGGLRLPTYAIGRDAAADLEPGSSLPVSFTVTEILPSSVSDPGSLKTGFGYTRTKFAVQVRVTDLRIVDQ